MNMVFSKRVQNLQAEGAYVVMERAQALEAQGRDIIHVEIGQPDFQTFDHIRIKGMEAIATGYTRYTPPGGIPPLRQVIAEVAGAQRNLHFTPQQVVVGPGAKPGLFFPTLALVEPGDEVIYPDPGFPTYSAMISIAGGVSVPVPLKEEKGFSFDLDVFDQLVNQRTRLIILNSPANPTGGVMPQADLEYIAAAAIKHDCWVISDEIYKTLVYDGLTVPTIASIPGMAERTIIVDGFSKTYAMTGWRLGYMIMPEALAGRVELLLNHSVGCTASFTQVAGIEALTSSQENAIRATEEYQRRRDRMINGLNSIPGVHCRSPQGAFYAFPNVKSFGTPVRELAQDMLNQVGVAVLPGTDFGEHGEGYLRLCYATSPTNIDLAVERMADFFSKR
jgi:aspartate aminotransferase